MIRFIVLTKYEEYEDEGQMHVNVLEIQSIEEIYNKNDEFLYSDVTFSNGRKVSVTDKFEEIFFNIQNTEFKFIQKGGILR